MGLERRQKDGRLLNDLNDRHWIPRKWTIEWGQKVQYKKIKYNSWYDCEQRW